MKVRGSKNIIIFLLAIFLIILYSFYYYFEKNKLKVILIALDGADWKVMQPLIDKGKLSNIKQLMDKGCWGGAEDIRAFRERDNMDKYSYWKNTAKARNNP